MGWNMKREDKNLLLAVVGNIMNQYVGRLKEHRELADEKFVAKTSYARDYNVVKCSKGITYAERIMDNLEAVLFRDKTWHRKELISVFHDKEYSQESIGNWDRTSDENQVAHNVAVVLGSMGIDALDIFATLSGYTSLRGRQELFNGEKWNSDVNTGNFGKLGINYGKPRDFAILFGTDKTDMEIDLVSPYLILIRRLLSKVKGYTGMCKLAEQVFDNQLRNFIFSVYPREYGSIVRSCDPIAPYQKEFVEFRNTCKQREIAKESYLDCFASEEFGMIV
jgi:hypothetical protein